MISLSFMGLLVCSALCKKVEFLSNTGNNLLFKRVFSSSAVDMQIINQPILETTWSIDEV